FGWSPVRASPVEWVENDVVFRVEKAARVLQRRVVDDGGIAPASNLPKHLHDDGGLASTGIRDDLHVLGLGLGRDAKHLLQPVDLDANSLPLYFAVELFRRDPLRPFEPPPVPHLFAALNVLSDRKGKLDEQGYETEQQWQLVNVEEAFATVNRTLEVGTQGRIDVGSFRVLVEQIIASVQGGLRERKRERFRSRFRCVAVCHVGVRGWSRP